MPDSLDFDGLRPRSPFVGESHALWRTQLRRFIDREIMPYAQDWDEAGAIPRELFLKAGEFGLLGAGFPVEYGG